MAKRVNTAIIGAFVISAIALFLISVVIFSSGTFSKKTAQFILFFDETVSGLNVGAPVKFRGVEIGSVKSVVLLADVEKQEVEIPIVIEVDPAKFRSKGDKKVEFKGDLDPLIEKGLRARLDLQSFVTGQYYIQIDFLPDTEVDLKGVDLGYEEIPTVKSSFTKLSETLKDIPLKQVVANVEGITRSIDEALEEGRLASFLERLNLIADHVDTVVVNADRMVNNLNTEASALADEMEEAINEAIETLNRIEVDVDSVTGSTNALLGNLKDELDPLAKELNDTLETAQKTLTDASNTLASTDRFINESEVRFRLAKALEEIGAAARSIRNFADYLERHPEALFQGRSKR